MVLPPKDAPYTGNWIPRFSAALWGRRWREIGASAQLSIRARQPG